MSKHEDVCPFILNIRRNASQVMTLCVNHRNKPSLYISSEKDGLLMIQHLTHLSRTSTSVPVCTQISFIETPGTAFRCITVATRSKTRRIFRLLRCFLTQRFKNWKRSCSRACLCLSVRCVLRLWREEECKGQEVNAEMQDISGALTVNHYFSPVGIASDNQRVQRENFLMDTLQKRYFRNARDRIFAQEVETIDLVYPKVALRAKRGPKQGYLPCSWT